MFQFKKFKINQSNSPQKVGTDGVLIGAWACLENKPNSILDIGAGTGLLALMLAQRSAAETIDAVEINEAAFLECVENFEQSPWSNRLFCYHSTLQEFTHEFFEEQTYDCIVSNPPFYTQNVKTPNAGRNQARFTDALPFEELVSCVEGLLSSEGIFNLILPYNQEEAFIQLAATYGLYPFKICRVKGNPQTEIKRSMLAFTRTLAETVFDTLTIEQTRHNYTAQYKSLTQDFYLHF